MWSRETVCSENNYNASTTLLTDKSADSPLAETCMFRGRGGGLVTCVKMELYTSFGREEVLTPPCLSVGENYMFLTPRGLPYAEFG